MTRKRGRPKLPRDQARVHTISIRLDPHEEELIASFANEHGMSIGQAARSLAINGYMTILNKRFSSSHKDQ